MRHRLAAVQHLEGFGDRPVERARARQPDLRVQRFLKKWMREVVHDVVGSAPLGEHVGGAELVDRRDERVVVELTDGGELGVRRLGAQHGGDVGESSGIGRQIRHARQHRLPNRRRHMKVLDVPSRPRSMRLAKLSALHQRRDGFVDEERVAAGPAVKPLGEIRDPRAFGAKSLLEQRHHVVDAERLKPESLRALESAQRTFRAAERRVPSQIRIVVRPDEEQALAADLSRDEVQHLERRAVRPLQVLEHEQQRLLRREAGEQLREIPQYARLQLGRIAARRRDQTIGVPPPRRERVAPAPPCRRA